MGSLSLPDDIRYKEFIVGRPLVGYGMTPPSFEWPNGAKIAINFVIQYHEGAESSVEYGDKESGKTIAPSPIPTAADLPALRRGSLPRFGDHLL